MLAESEGGDKTVSILIGGRHCGLLVELGGPERSVQGARPGLHSSQ